MGVHGKDNLPGATATTCSAFAKARPAATTIADCKGNGPRPATPRVTGFVTRDIHPRRQRLTIHDCS